MNLITETRDTYLKSEKSLERKEKRIQAKIKHFRSEIDSIQKKIDGEQSKKSKTDSHWWGDALVKPIIDEIAKREHLTHDGEKLLPFGMKARVPVFFYKSSKDGKKDLHVSYHLTFVPSDLGKGLLHLETKKTKNGKKHDWKNDPNNFGLIDIDCPDTIDGIIKFMKSEENN
jgi:hypothetical protein